MTDHKWPNVMIIRHPVVQEKLTRARDKQTPSEEFRRLISQITSFMAFELTRDFPTEPRDVQTPLGTSPGCVLARRLTLVPILRAGQGMLNGVLELLPSSRVGYLGIYRDEKTLKPVVYYNKLPPDIAQTDVIVIDPMLATAGSVREAVTVIKKTGARRIKMLCLVASPEGIDALLGEHPDVDVYTAAVDRGLNERGYILPGLGDAGDRLFGTA